MAVGLHLGLCKLTLTHSLTNKRTNKQTNKQTTNKQTNVKQIPRGMYASRFMYAQTNKQTKIYKQRNTYMSAPTGLSAPRFTYAHTHKQTINQTKNKQTDKQQTNKHLYVCT